jgi:hypothetical protein
MWDAIVIFIKLRPAVEDFYHKAHAEWQDYWNKITGTRSPIMASNHLLKSAVRSRPSLTTLSLKTTSQSLSSITSFFSLSTMQLSISKAGVEVLVMAQFGR